MVVLSLPGPGDAMSQAAAVLVVPRSRAQLEKRRVTLATGKVRDHSLGLFSDWLHRMWPKWTLEELTRLHPISLAEALEEYGKLAFTSGWTRHNFAETLNSVQTRFQ